MERIRKGLAALKARLQETLRTRDATLSRAATELAEEEAAFKSACERMNKGLEESLQRLDAETQENRKHADLDGKRRITRARNTCLRVKALAMKPLRDRAAEGQARRQKTHEEANHEYEETTGAAASACAGDQARLEEFEKTADALNEQITAFAMERRVRLDAVRLKESLEHIPAEIEPVAAEVKQRLAETEELLASGQRKTKRRMSVLIPHAVVLLGHVAAWWHYASFATDTQQAMFVGASLVICLTLVQGVWLAVKGRVYGLAMTLARNIDTVRALIQRQRQVMNARLEHVRSHADALFSKRVAEVDAEAQEQAAEHNKLDAEFAAKLFASRDKLIARITREKDATLARLAKQGEEAAAKLRQDHDQALAKRRAEYAARKAAIEGHRDREHARLAAEWAQTLAECHAFEREAMAQQRRDYPPWPSLSPKNLALPAEFRSEVYTGDVTVALKGVVPESDAEGKFSIPAGDALKLPLVLSYPLEGSLYIRAGLTRREEGLQILSGAVLRLLCGCPPAKAKLTILDPVGLGQNFAALMHLADYDESLVNGRIWSDTAHIERKLTDLTEHMEKVIQKYLRNRYASIDEYNKEAGQMAEPYRFLVIADFPTGFSEIALDRLASIASSGARCGVYPLILHDARQKLPPSVDERLLRKNGLAIVEEGDGFLVDDPLLNRGPFKREESATPAQVDALLNAVGRQCREAVRVEVPFDAAAPKDGAFWSLSADNGIRLPLGKAGADRMQCLELGRGTAQHALIAGKTGSGKSNLFHVIITNAALWYGPREVEFYLIDFKKGVEFKTYGVHQLPHARVIAIESDREFGLSVLRRLDKELSRRGELFRQARVQDLPSFRKRNPTEVLPRTLLIIDEFQEFFTEDDGVAQDAALLLDRIVRQGRAFGIHVVLGSQTLGGTYTLAKSTLGQMAVRIALQCNEADSYLILSDDNAAARLLSRPGEAIYNDMSGQIEGNNPFQTVWFPKDMQDSFLRRVHQKAEAERVKLAQPTVVFEGNALAELKNNPLLREIAGQGRAADVSVKAWLGEANAIKGPTEAEFARHAGRNLLIVGQRGDAGLAMCCSSLVCLAANHAPGEARFCVLDGTAPDSGAKERLAALAAALPHPMKVVEYRDVPQAMEELSEVLKRRREGEDPDRNVRHYLLVMGLQRFRMLREDDDFSFSSSESTTRSPSQRMLELLSEGPAEGMHAIVWCDTLGNLTRSFNRKTLREFEMRVLYQMSAADSAELIESPAANRLGLYNALLFTVQDGATEKFRPYSAPDKDLVQELSRMLRARQSNGNGAAVSAERRETSSAE
jgi:hypothetical protein